MRRFLWYRLNPVTPRSGASFMNPMVVSTITLNNEIKILKSTLFVFSNYRTSTVTFFHTLEITSSKPQENFRAQEDYCREKERSLDKDWCFYLTSFNVVIWGLYVLTSKYLKSSLIWYCCIGFPLNTILKFVNVLRYRMEAYAWPKEYGWIRIVSVCQTNNAENRNFIKFW